MPTTPDPSMGLVLQLLFLAVLILINAFFASAEMAIVSANKNKLKVMMQEGNKKAKLLLDLLDTPNKFLSTIQVAITLAGFLASASAATSIGGLIGKYLTEFGIPYGTQAAIVIVTVILSYITLVFGELYPKRIALQHSEKLALISVKPIILISKLTAPFVALLSVSVSFLMKVTGQTEESNTEEYDEDEIKSILEVGQETGLIKEAGKEMIKSIFEFDDKLAYEVMTPRTDVYMININEKVEDYIDELLEKRYSRIPVYEKDSDNVIGIIYMKDFIIQARKLGFENVDIRNLLRKPYLVPESKNIDDLFREMQASKVHIAILIDEYGGMAGIVTIEDLIEEVMGNIDDEYDDYEAKLEKIDENTYLIDGAYYLDDLNEELNLNLESEEHETIGGLIIDILGEIPEENEPEERIIELKNCVIKIESVKDRRIEKVKLYIIPIKEEELEEELEEAQAKE
ncbi:hemolysin family protein [Anaerovorax odorimutans]|uniref:hemolysin family protein n=1 Tax=Anaerovorax odorimutans TaxID=109327 RepID=UPI0003F60611|nr:hemolysin family protein [Anaerovorax odorimutans]